MKIFLEPELYITLTETVRRLVRSVQSTFLYSRRRSLENIFVTVHGELVFKQQPAIGTSRDNGIANGTD
jgi:hypothetical protein